MKSFAVRSIPAQTMAGIDMTLSVRCSAGCPPGSHAGRGRCSRDNRKLAWEVQTVPSLAEALACHDRRDVRTVRVRRVHRGAIGQPVHHLDAHGLGHDHRVRRDRSHDHNRVRRDRNHDRIRIHGRCGKGSHPSNDWDSGHSRHIGNQRHRVRGSCDRIGRLHSLRQHEPSKKGRCFRPPEKGSRKAQGEPVALLCVLTVDWVALRDEGMWEIPRHSIMDEGPRRGHAGRYGKRTCILRFIIGGITGNIEQIGKASPHVC